MSSLWTPSGEYRPQPSEPSGSAPRGEALDEATVAEELRRVRADIANTPVVDIVANHAIGLWNLAALHLSAEERPPDLAAASLAVDAMAALVEGLGDRLGEHAPALRDALTQIRLLYVQVQSRTQAHPAP